jgi:hypothetical protein
MSRLERIGDRFPRLYRTWEKESLLYVLLRAISNQLDKTESGVVDIMKAHWIDTAEGDELDKFSLLFRTKRLSEEDDAHLRTHLKRAVDEYKGGGTFSVIMEEFKTTFKGEKDLQIIENPPSESFAEFLVIANDTWFVGSNSIKNEEAILSLTVEGEGQVSNPIVTNVDTGESITFNGQLKKGEKLVIEKNHAMLNEKDATQSVKTNKAPLLLRKGSHWKYSEALLELIGVFDGGKFDENTFAMGVPTVRVRFDWTRQQPATFMVQVKSKALAESGLTLSNLEKTANYLKAAGVNAIIKVTE